MTREAFVIEHTHEDGRVEQVRVLRWEVFQRWRRRATAAFAFVVVVSSLGLYLAEHAGSKSDRGLRDEAQRAVTRSCNDRADTRIAVAVGFDELRRLAIPPARTEAERAQQRQFLTRTQEPINSLLSEAAGVTVKTAGEVLSQDIEAVRSRAEKRCVALGEGFDRGASANG